MKIITWNINSVRLRLPLVLRLLAEQAPDVLCLQETKCPDDKFPHEELENAGYHHRAIRGEKAIMAWRFYRNSRFMIFAI